MPAWRSFRIWTITDEGVVLVDDKFAVDHDNIVSELKKVTSKPRDSQWSLPTVAFEGHLSMQLGGKRVELYHFGRGHTNGDVVVYFPGTRTLAAGDFFVSDPATPQFVDDAGGGSAKEWTTTLDSALQLDSTA